jgi:hypothetical protein
MNYVQNQIKLNHVQNQMKLNHVQINMNYAKIKIRSNVLINVLKRNYVQISTNIVVKRKNFYVQIEKDSRSDGLYEAQAPLERIQHF